MSTSSLPRRILAYVVLACTGVLVGIAVTMYALPLIDSPQRYAPLTTTLGVHGIRRVYQETSPEWDIVLNMQAMYFEPTVHYELNSSVADAQWAAMVPQNGGVVYVGPDRQPYLLSMFHQLRCLDIIRKAYNSYEGLSSEGPTAVTLHCLHYLRQMVLCRRDTRLEPVIDTEGPHAVRAWGPMTCKNWNQVYDAHARNIREE